MNPLLRIIKRRRERAAEPAKPSRKWSPKRGLWYCADASLELLEPGIPRVSRVQGESFDRLVDSIQIYGLANPLIVYSELPGEPNHDDWREWRLRFLYEIAAPLKLQTGHNRLAAIKELGWERAPMLLCGPIPEAAAGELWTKVRGVKAAQKLLRDGRLGIGPYGLEMVEFTPPLKGVPKGFEPLGNSERVNVESAS